MNDSASVLQRVTSTIVAIGGCDVSRVKPESQLITDLNLESLDMIEIVIALEEEFGVELPDSEFEAIVTVAQVAALVESRVLN